MNNLSNAAIVIDRRRRRRGCFSFGCDCEPIPAVVIYTLSTLFLLTLAFSIFILAVVHNPILFILHIFLSSLIAAFLLWNCLNYTRNGAFLSYLHSLPDSDLRYASDRDIVKITGVVSCGSVSLESSYEKVDRCIYTSTSLYEFGNLGLKPADVNRSCFQRRLALSERFSADFHITDSKSGMRALVKAGSGCKVIPLVSENKLVNTARNHQVLSSHLRKWLKDRDLPTEARPLCLEEGYIKEGSYASVIGMLHKNGEDIMIGQPSELISTGCLWWKLLLPVDVEGLILGIPKITDDKSTTTQTESNI